MRFRHIGHRPQVSATHLPGEELAVTVHGRAVPVDVRAPEGAELRETLMQVYLPKVGPQFEDFLDGRTGEGGGDPPVYARIEADRMFTFRMVAD